MSISNPLVISEGDGSLGSEGQRFGQGTTAGDVRAVIGMAKAMAMVGQSEGCDFRCDEGQAQRWLMAGNGLPHR